MPQGVTIGAKVRFVRIYELLVKGQKQIISDWLSERRLQATFFRI